MVIFVVESNFARCDVHATRICNKVTHTLSYEFWYVIPGMQCFGSSAADSTGIGTSASARVHCIDFIERCGSGR